MLCPGSYKPIGRVPRREKTVCEVCGEECTVSQPSPKEERAGSKQNAGRISQSLQEQKRLNTLRTFQRREAVTAITPLGQNAFLSNREMIDECRVANPCGRE